ncbi:PTS fructose transporter subunit IIB [Enterococcus sp. DIV0756]|uniref:PTS fructose transporter subunit IIB n=1 Tax=Enterococcus sp. DIV0756 TaxID=2774636 RepID=UPI003F29662A
MKFVGVAACPAGLMHTFMASKALKKAAKKSGHELLMETQSASGIENQLTQNDIDSADAVVLAIDTAIQGMDRFADIPVLKINTTEALAHSKALIQQLAEMGDS